MEQDEDPDSHPGRRPGGDLGVRAVGADSHTSRGETGRHLTIQRAESRCQPAAFVQKLLIWLLFSFERSWAAAPSSLDCARGRGPAAMIWPKADIAAMAGLRSYPRLRDAIVSIT